MEAVNTKVKCTFLCTTPKTWLSLCIIKTSSKPMVTNKFLNRKNYRFSNTSPFSCLRGPTKLQPSAEGFIPHKLVLHQCNKWELHFLPFGFFVLKKRGEGEKTHLLSSSWPKGLGVSEVAEYTEPLGSFSASPSGCTRPKLEVHAVVFLAGHWLSHPNDSFLNTQEILFKVFAPICNRGKVLVEEAFQKEILALSIKEITWRPNSW